MTAFDSAPPAATAAQPKRATNLTLSADVLAQAKALNINVSQACDAFLRALVRKEQAKRWREDHAGYVAAHNATLAKEGLPLDQWRAF
jgi:antitoxin CcdA